MGDLGAKLWMLLVVGSLRGCGFEERGAAIVDCPDTLQDGHRFTDGGNFMATHFGFGQLTGADKFYLHVFADELFSGANVVMYNFGSSCNFAPVPPRR